MHDTTILVKIIKGGSGGNVDVVPDCCTRVIRQNYDTYNTTLRTECLQTRSKYRKPRTTVEMYNVTK